MTNRAADRDAREPHERMRALNQRQRKSNSAIHFQTLKLNRKVKILQETFEPNVLGNTILRTVSFSIGSLSRRNYLDSAFGSGDYARAIGLGHDACAIRQRSDIWLVSARGMGLLAAARISERIETWILRRRKLRPLLFGIPVWIAAGIMRCGRRNWRLIPCGLAFFPVFLGFFFSLRL